MLAHWIRTPHATTSPPVGAVQTWRGQRESRDTDTSAWTEPMQRICIHDVDDDARHLVTVGKKPPSFLPSSAPPLVIRAWRTLPSIYVSMEGWTPALPGKHNEKSSHHFAPCHLQCSSGSMAGLSVVLDTHKQNHPAGKPQIVSKTSLPLHHRRRTSTPTASSFLQRCFLCHKELAKDSDIYMYRGDRAFCSVECRRRQISMDEDDAVGGFAD